MKDYVIVDSYGDAYRENYIYVKSNLDCKMANILHLYGLPFRSDVEKSLFVITESVLWEEDEITKIKEFIAQAWEKM